MIIKLFRRPSVIAQLTQSPAAAHLDALVLALREQGYAAETIKHYVLCAERFCHWLDEQCFKFTDVNEILVNRYTTGLPRRILPSHPNGIPHKHPGGLFHLVAVLRQAHIIPPLQLPTPATEAERWLARYGDHLDQRQGAAWSTRRKCLHYVRRLIEFRFPGANPDWSTLDASDIVNFLAGQACHGKGAVKTAASAVRSLLRFLVLEGVVRPGLEAAVPPVPRWRLSGLPRYLTTEQVDQVLKVCRQSFKSRGRNTAVLLLLARLGLRADEVAGLQIDDVDSGGVDDGNRSVSPLGPADNLKSYSMQRVEWVEHLDTFVLRTQGIVSADGIISISITWFRPVAFPPITGAGSTCATASSSPERCWLVFSAASLSPPSGRPSPMANSASTVT